jgi:hypothetical protein
MKEQFYDPELKTAVKRQWGNQAAPNLLRARIEQIFANTAAASTRAVTRRRREKIQLHGWFGPLWMSLAAAAMVALALGTTFWMDHAYAYVSADEGLQFNAVQWYPSNMIGGAVHGKSLHEVGKTLSNQMYVPVICADIPNWKFVGAWQCQIDGRDAAQVMYCNDVNQYFSVFTLRRLDFKHLSRNATYDQDIKGYHVAAFTKGNGLYCIVTSDQNITQAVGPYLARILSNNYDKVTVFVPVVLAANINPAHASTSFIP